MSPEQRREVIWTPLAIWATLMALLAATVAYAYVPALPFKTEAALLIGLAKALLIALFFMQLKKAAALVRLAAIVGLAWGSLLYIFSMADVLTR